MAREATWLDHPGGHLALDFVNTVSWRNDARRRREWLDGASALAAWTGARGLPVVGTASAARLADLRELREAVLGVVLDRIDPPAGDPRGPHAAVLAAAARDAVGRARLDLGTGRWIADPVDARGLHDYLALAAVDLLATADPARLHACADADCGWLFLDTSRSGTRRWCDAAGCGNRARARRHRERSRP